MGLEGHRDGSRAAGYVSWKIRNSRIIATNSYIVVQNGSIWVGYLPVSIMGK